MNTTKSVYNKLFQEDKVELASERVELSLKDDIEKTLNNLYGDFDSVDKAIVKFYDQLFVAKKTYEAVSADMTKVLAYEKTLQGKRDELLKVGKELGIDVTGSAFYKDAIAALNRFADIKSEFKVAESAYKSIKL